MGSYNRKKKVVIITEAIIVNDIIKLARGEGATGYTLTSVKGQGSRGKRRYSQDSFITLFENIKIEIITDEETAKKILEAVPAKFFNHYAGIIYAEDVEVPQVE